MPLPALENMRIVEISAGGFFKTTFPAQTRHFNTGPAHYHHPRPQDPGSLMDLARLLNSGDFDIVACAPPTHGPLHWQTISRFVFSRYLSSNLRRPLRHFGPQLLRLHRAKPLAVIDFADTASIDRGNFYLLDQAALYFKRELPGDEWRLLAKTASDTLPGPRLRQDRRFQARLAKLRPLPLGLPRGHELDLPAKPVAKETDVFFAGTVDGMPVRQRALAELARLRGEGFVIDIADRPLTRKEFYRRMAGAWLTLSPEGLGWDCFRHYEAAACGSVPLINYPTIRRHLPLVHGEHALFFETEPGFLARRVREALADKPRLAAIAEAGRAHVLANHTLKAILTYVLRETLATSPGLAEP